MATTKPTAAGRAAGAEKPQPDAETTPQDQERDAATTGTPGSGVTSEPGASAAVTQDPQALADELARVKAENAALRAAVDQPPAGTGETRLAYLVTYPSISVQAREGGREDGEVQGEPFTLTQGQELPKDCLWQAEQLLTVGHVVALPVPVR
jgi:hypothetical protein